MAPIELSLVEFYTEVIGEKRKEANDSSRLIFLNSSRIKQINVHVVLVTVLDLI